VLITVSVLQNVHHLTTVTIDSYVSAALIGPTRKL